MVFEEQKTLFSSVCQKQINLHIHSCTWPSNIRFGSFLWNVWLKDLIFGQKSKTRWKFSISLNVVLIENKTSYTNSGNFFSLAITHGGWVTGVSKEAQLLRSCEFDQGLSFFIPLTKKESCCCCFPFFTQKVLQSKHLQLWEKGSSFLDLLGGSFRKRKLTVFCILGKIECKMFYWRNQSFLNCFIISSPHTGFSGLPSLFLSNVALFLNQYFPISSCSAKLTTTSEEISTLAFLPTAKPKSFSTHSATTWLELKNYTSFILTRCWKLLKKSLSNVHFKLLLNAFKASKNCATRKTSRPTQFSRAYVVLLSASYRSFPWFILKCNWNKLSSNEITASFLRRSLKLCAFAVLTTIFVVRMKRLQSSLRIYLSTPTFSFFFGIIIIFWC